MQILFAFGITELFFVDIDNQHGEDKNYDTGYLSKQIKNEYKDYVIRDEDNLLKFDTDGKILIRDIFFSIVLGIIP